MKITLFGLEIEQHQHEQVQDENGARIHHDLDGPEEFGIEEDE